MKFLKAVLLCGLLATACDKHQSPASPDPAPPPDPVPAPPPAVEPVSFPLATAWFYAYGRYGSHPEAPQHWTVVVDSNADVPSTMPVIISRISDPPDYLDMVAHWASRWDQVAGIFVTSENGDLAGQVAKAVAQEDALGLPHRPLLSYTGSNIGLALSVSGVRWVGVQCYRVPGSTLAADEAAWRRQLDQVVAAGRRPAIIGGAYDRNGKITAQEVQAAFPRFLELARDYHAAVLAWFAWARPGGGLDYGLGALAAEETAATHPPAIN